MNTQTTCERCGKTVGCSEWDIHTCTPPAQPATEDSSALATPMQEPVAWLKRHELADLRTCNHRRLGADSPNIWAPNAPDVPPPELDLVAVYTTPPAAPVQEPAALDALVKEEMRYYHDGHYLDSSDAKYQLLSFAHRISKSVRASTPPAAHPTTEESSAVAAPVQPVDIATLVEGMEVSIDVSTGEHDSGNRLFGSVTLVQQNQGSKHGLILLVQEPEANFKTAAPPAAPVQSLPFGVGGGLVAIKTLLSRDPCAHATVAIQMIDAILAEHSPQKANTP